MTTQWFEKFMQILKEILEKPPYLVFVFIGTIFMVISIITNNFLNQNLIFFIYSVIGLVWRYIEKDVEGGLRNYIQNKKDRENLGADKFKIEITRKISVSHLVVIVIYHMGNFSLIFALLSYLKFI